MAKFHNLRLPINFVCANSNGSYETAQRSLVRTFAAHICDKFLILINWLKCTSCTSYDEIFCRYADNVLADRRDNVLLFSFFFSVK